MATKAFNKAPQEWQLTSAWAELPAASSVASGTVATVTDIGQGHTKVASNGTYWRVLNSTDIVFTNGALVGTYASTLSGVDQVVLSVTLPAGILRAGRYFGIKALFGRAGETDDATAVTLRLGTEGTVEDAAVLSSALLVKEAKSLAVKAEGYLTSATNFRLLGNQSGGTGWTGAASAVAYPVDILIPNVDTATIKVSAGIDMAGTTDLGYVHSLIVTLYP